MCCITAGAGRGSRLGWVTGLLLHRPGAWFCPRRSAFPYLQGGKSSAFFFLAERKTSEEDFRGSLPRKSSSGGMQSRGRRREDVPGGPDSGGVHTLADKEAPIIPVYECVSHSAVLEAMTRGSRQGFFLIPRSPGGNAFFLFFLFFLKKDNSISLWELKRIFKALRKRH